MDRFDHKRRNILYYKIEKTKKGFEMYEIDLDKIDLTGHPPDKEPERQYYFMAKCREYVQRLNEKWGHPPTYTTVTFGCPKV